MKRLTIGALLAAACAGAPARQTPRGPDLAPPAVALPTTSASAAPQGDEVPGPGIESDARSPEPTAGELASGLRWLHVAGAADGIELRWTLPRGWADGDSGTAELVAAVLHGAVGPDGIVLSRRTTRSALEPALRDVAALLASGAPDAAALARARASAAYDLLRAGPQVERVAIALGHELVTERHPYALFPAVGALDTVSASSLRAAWPRFVTSAGAELVAVGGDRDAFVAAAERAFAVRGAPPPPRATAPEALPAGRVAVQVLSRVHGAATRVVWLAPREPEARAALEQALEILVARVPGWTPWRVCLARSPGLVGLAREEALDPPGLLALLGALPSTEAPFEADDETTARAAYAARARARTRADDPAARADALAASARCRLERAAGAPTTAEVREAATRYLSVPFQVATTGSAPSPLAQLAPTVVR